MTPNRIREIYGERGFKHATATAAACQDSKLEALVRRLHEKENGVKKHHAPHANVRTGKTARKRADGTLARAVENRAARAAENRERAMSHS